MSEQVNNPRMIINPVTGRLEVPTGPIPNYPKEESDRPYNSLEQVIKKQKQNEHEKSSSVEDNYSHLLANNESIDTTNKMHYGDVNLDEDDEDDSEESEASNSILVGSRSVPRVLIKFKRARFGLYSNVPVHKGSEDTLQHFTDKVEKSFENMDVIFSVIKKSLLSYTPSSELANNEMTIEIKELDIVLEEDNKYNKNITLQDLCSVFRSLSDNTENKDDEDLGILTFEIKTKKRFLNRYNELVELVDNKGNLSHIKKFSNDSGHPVVLDDDDDSNPIIDKRIINTSVSNPDDEDEIVILD